tara:strand:- start:102 stop:341 length:240 start_codon:yes stop_codon:yes gene_type:complete
MLTNPITGKIIKQATSNKFLLEVVNNWFPNKHIPNGSMVFKKKLIFNSNFLIDDIKLTRDTYYNDYRTSTPIRPTLPRK